MANQLVFDFDFALDPEFEKLDLNPPTQAKEEVVAARAKPSCTCGAQHVNIKPYMQGHSEWCTVHEDKTPVT